MEFKTKKDLLKCVRNELVSMNPNVEETGIKGLLEYRMNYRNKLNISYPDSIYIMWNKKLGKYVGKSKLSEIYAKLYDINPFDMDEYGSSDIIFNAWSFIRNYSISKSNGKCKSEKDIMSNYDKIFDEDDEITKLLNMLSDYHHSIANFMPAPVGYNGCKNYDGKGNFYEDNDMPDLYYQRSKNFHYLEKKHKWIDEHMEKLSLEFFKEFESYKEVGFASSRFDYNNPEKLNKFKKSVENVIECIEKRASKIFEKI